MAGQKERSVLEAARKQRFRRRKKFKISISSLGIFLTCPAQYFFNYYSGAPKHTDYPRFCGVKVHNFIQKLEVGTRKFHRGTWTTPRRFFFNSLDAALGAWKREWMLAVRGATQTGYLLNPNDNDTFMYMNNGITCIRNYWNANENLSLPLEVESSYEYPWGDTGVSMVGHMDQVRTVRLDYIRAKRPELIDSNGQLDSRFAPVMIVDFKTGWSSYDAADRKKENEVPTLEEQMRTQYPLHYGIQATAYSWLYFKYTGKWPIGFWWNHLRSNRVFLTYRDNFPEDAESLGRKYLRELDAVVQHLIDCEHALSFPKHVANHCKGCDFIVPCLGSREFRISPGEPMNGEALDPTVLETMFQREKNPQKRFKMKVERVKKTPILEIPSKNPQPVIIQRDLPWREDDPFDSEIEAIVEDEIETLEFD